MAMNYNDIEAPNFVDFGGNFEEEGEGDSWFSNDSINFDSADVTLDKSQVGGFFMYCFVLLTFALAYF